MSAFVFADDDGHPALIEAYETQAGRALLIDLGDDEVRVLTFDRNQAKALAALLVCDSCVLS